MAMKSSNEALRLDIAGTCMEIVSSEPDFQKAVAVKYKGFMTAKPVDLVLRLVFFPVNSIAPQAKEGEVYWTSAVSEKEVTLCIFGSEPHIRMTLFNVVLHCVFRHVANTQNHTRFLMHGGVVEKSGQGFIVSGPSGIGKTTMCRLILESAIEARVLTDEKICISQPGGDIMVSNTPLGGDLSIDESITVPLRAIFFLNQSDKPALRLMNSEEALKHVQNQMTPAFIIDGLNLKRKSEIDLTTDVIKKVPVYELSFRKDLSFWPMVAGVMEEKRREEAYADYVEEQAVTGVSY